jgi:hypothetical protein
VEWITPLEDLLKKGKKFHSHFFLKKKYSFRHAMFPYQEKHSLFDDYGEVTNEKDFLNEPMIVDENGVVFT